MNNNEMIKFLKERIKRLNEIGLALSKEDDTNVIFEMILALRILARFNGLQN